MAKALGVSADGRRRDYMTGVHMHHTTASFAGRPLEDILNVCLLLAGA